MRLGAADLLEAGPVGLTRDPGSSEILHRPEDDERRRHIRQPDHRLDVHVVLTHSASTSCPVPLTAPECSAYAEQSPQCKGAAATLFRCPRRDRHPPRVTSTTFRRLRLWSAR